MLPDGLNKNPEADPGFDKSLVSQLFNQNVNKFSIWKLLCNFRFNGLMFAAFLNFFILDYENAIIGFFYPVLGISSELRGIVVLAYAIPWVITANLVHNLTNRFPKRLILFLSYILVIIGVAIWGCTSYTGLSPSIPMHLIGSLIYGVGLGFMLVPVLPEMRDTAVKLFPEVDEGVMMNRISSVFTISCGVGNVAGPMFGTWMYNV